MEIKIENILILWDEKVTDIFVSLINTLSLSFSETEIRRRMTAELGKEYPGYCCIATLERSYTE